MVKSNSYYMDGILILVTIIWGIKPTAIKIGLRYMDPINYNVMRLIIASIAAWFFVVISGDNTKISRKDLKNILFISVCGFFIFQWFYGIGIDKTTAANASIIMATLPLIVALVNHVAGISKASLNTYKGIGISVAGVVTVVLGTGNLGVTPDNIIGCLYILLSALGYGVYMVFSKQISTKYSARLVTAYAITITTILSIIFSGFSIYPGDINRTLILSLIYSGVIAMYIGNYIWTWAIKKSSSNRVSIYNNLTPIFSVISANIFLEEGFTIIQFIGFGLIILGLYFSSYKSFGHRKAI